MHFPRHLVSSAVEVRDGVLASLLIVADPHYPTEPRRTALTIHGGGH